MKQIFRIALNCARQLDKTQRSANRITRTAVRPVLDSVYYKISLIKQRQTPPKELELREIDAALHLAHDAICEACACESPTPQLDQLGKLITAAFPPPVIPREKAKPTIQLTYKK